ncbi:MAG TPA: NAD(P)/FAD-dependent oxidoreductase [Thermomicrobiales bacterium]|nr:NAD(P)/FAD-dependent oxidoreductase [Thermomicrobiales bacterium]
MSLDPGTTIVDTAIIGGGIAGSSLAIVLQRSGLDVALIEREPYFRDRIRGEAIHPWGVQDVHALGLLPILDDAGAIALPFWTRYRDAEAATPYRWADDFPDSPGGISVNHVRLQDTLLREASAAGARVFRPASASATLVDDGWEIRVDGPEGETTLRTPLLVGADGQRSATRALIGGKATRDPIHHRMGGMLVRGIDLPRDSAHQAFHDTGFSMTYLQDDGLARVYYVYPDEEARELQGAAAKDAFLARTGALYPAGAFAAAEPAGPLGFFPNADLVSDRIAGPHALLIGDAASANDPSQGHGLALVFHDIRTLRDLLGSEPIGTIPETFAAARSRYYTVLRNHASWAAPLSTETGPEIDALRAQIDRAREADPTAGGFAGIFATGPDGLVADDRARAHFYGEDLPGATIFSYPRHDR